MTTIARRIFMRLNTMSLPRRGFLQLAASAAAVPAWARIAAAFDYPTRPVRMLVGFAPGAAPDILARLIGQWLSDRFAKPFVVENKPGGSGGLANEAVINAAPDGYSLLMVGIGYAINSTLYKDRNYNFARDLTPVAGLSREPNVMIVSFRAKAFPNSSPMPKPTPGRSTWPPPESEHRHTWPASCSSSWPGST
jgi:hypothetical protein